MKNMLIKTAAMFIVFFVGTAALLTVDRVCEETAEMGGKLVLDVEKWGVFE